MTHSVIRWGVEWRSENRLEGKQRRIMWCNCFPLLFLTRKQARDYIAEQYGYIATRRDLRVEPHGWRMPAAVRVKVTVRRVQP